MAAAGGVAGSGVGVVTTAHTTKTVLRNKVLVVGDAAVGKSALIQFFTSGGSDRPKNYLMVCASFQAASLTVLSSVLEICCCFCVIMHAVLCGVLFAQTTVPDFHVRMIQQGDSSVWVELFLIDQPGQNIFNQREYGTKHVRIVWL